MPIQLYPVPRGVAVDLGPLVPLGGGYVLHVGPFGIEAFDEPDIPVDLKMTVELRDGRYRCTELSLKERPERGSITSELLREIPIARIMAVALESMMRASGESIDADDELALVAAWYQLAYACSLRPTKTVAEVLQVPISTASKKVMRARAAGLLDPTTPGKAAPKSRSARPGGGHGQQRSGRTKKAIKTGDGD